MVLSFDLELLLIIVLSPILLSLAGLYHKKIKKSIYILKQTLRIVNEGFPINSRILVVYENWFILKLKILKLYPIYILLIKDLHFEQ